MPARILISAGEASGDRYAARLVEWLRQFLSDASFFGCTGPQMRAAGVQTVVDSASLAVVGLVEVLRHIPRIYGEYRKLLASAGRTRPDLAILTDSPDFHLPVARRLHQMGIPVVYLVAPQAWAWREGRIGTLRRNVNELHCIFPFEESFFRERGVEAHYIGHPLSRLVCPALSRSEFRQQQGVEEGQTLISLCPGSRHGEMVRHVPMLAEVARRTKAQTGSSMLLAVPPGASRFGTAFFPSLLGDAPVRVVEGQTWDALAHCDLALIASGTVTIEAALLGTPMVTFYKVAPVSWAIGRRFVRVPHLTMVNLVAERRIVGEYMQDEATPETLTREAVALARDPSARRQLREALLPVAARLSTEHDPLEYSARRIVSLLRPDGGLALNSKAKDGSE